MPVVRVRAHLRSPLCLVDPLHLDGLAAGCSDGMSDGLGRDAPASAIREPRIPVRALDMHGHRVYLASAHILPESARTRSDHLTRRRDGDDIDHLTRPYDISTGLGATRMARLPAISTAYVDWLVVARRKALRRLIMRRVTHVGMRRRHGMGEVDRWEFETLDLPIESVLIAHGAARRNLPASWCDDPPIVESVPLRAPYWHQSSFGPGVRAGRAAALRDDVLEQISLLC